MTITDVGNLFMFAGGLGMFLYGMHSMSGGIQKTAGNKMKELLGILTSNHFMAVVVGALVTAIIQSSGATTYAPLLVGIGAFLIMFSKKAKKQTVGEILVGLGLLFIGLDFMGDAAGDYLHLPIFTRAFELFGSNPILGILIGVIVGCINGFGVAIMKAPSLIFTLGVNGILRGLMFIYTDGADVNNIPKSFKDISAKALPGVRLTYYFIGALILTIIIHLILTNTRKGRYVKAVGDNADGAKLVGINPVATKFVSYIICSVMASIAGILFCSRIGIVTTSSGNGYEMTAVAACVLGGISLTGGVGSVIGSAIGAVIMSSISYLLVFMGFSSDYNDAITGSILIVIVVVASVMQIRSRMKLRHERLQARTRDDMNTEEGDA